MHKWTDFPFELRVGILLLFLAATLVFAAHAKAVEPGWYSPLDGSGQGIIVRCNSSDECVASWLTYAGGQAWFISTENCPRADTVCAFQFARTEGQWFGSEFELGPVEITAEVEQTSDSILVDFDARRLFPERCDTGSGGLILNDCIGVAEFFILAR